MLYKCPNCGGELAFDPNSGKLKCKFCDSTYDPNTFEEQYGSGAHEHEYEHDHQHEPNHNHDQDHESQQEAQPAADIPPIQSEQPKEDNIASEQGFYHATDDSTDVVEDLRVWKCPHCGAEVVSDKDTVATNCVFCNTPLMLEEQMTGTFRPKSIIPFQVDRKQIEKIYEDYIKTKPFYPPEYSKANVIEKIKSVYLPFWLYDVNTSGWLRATGEHTISHTTRDWIITDHQVFNIERDGNMEFKNIPVIADSKTPVDAMDSIEPFDFSDMKEFNTAYLPGFLAERYDLDAHKCQDKMETRAANTFDQALSSTIGGYSAVKMTGGDMRHRVENADFALMPAYLLFMDFDNNADKLIAINGQTGKIVGNIPVDNKKRLRFFLIRFLLFWLILGVILVLLMSNYLVM